jgi:predicted alpha/beta hydrolase family esterase
MGKLFIVHGRGGSGKTHQTEQWISQAPGRKAFEGVQPACVVSPSIGSHMV